MKKLRWWVLGLLVALLGAAYLNKDTFSMYQEQLAIKNKNEARMKAAEEERARLLNRRTQLESPIGQEELARQQGYKKKGEKPLIVLPSGSAPESPDKGP